MPGEKDLEPYSSDVRGLQEQIQDLQGQLSELQANTQALWELLILIGSRLQMSSTSIKMAVSSLLDYEIFWDPSSSHEFLQVIDTSTDQTSDLVILLTLAFRGQAKSLEINPEPHSIQEILETLRSSIDKRDFETRLTVDYPPDGKPVLVDYQYLILALTLLFEVVISERKGLEKLSLQALESPTTWELRIGDLGRTAVSIFQHFFRYPKDFKEFASKLLPENTLKLIVACRILRLQNIELVDMPMEQATSLHLSIPVADIGGGQ